MSQGEAEDKHIGGSPALTLMNKLEWRSMRNMKKPGNMAPQKLITIQLNPKMLKWLKCQMINSKL
jgi:hypothetical protein